MALTHGTVYEIRYGGQILPSPLPDDMPSTSVLVANTKTCANGNSVPITEGSQTLHEKLTEIEERLYCTLNALGVGSTAGSCSVAMIVNGSIRPMALSQAIANCGGLTYAGGGGGGGSSAITQNLLSVSGQSISSTVNGVQSASVTLPSPTVSFQVTGSGASRAIAPVVNGTTGAAVALPDADAQALTLSGSTLSISGGNSVTLPSSSAPTVTLQTAGSGATRTIAPVVNGAVGTPVAVPDTDLDSQTLSISGSTLSISGGNTVTLPSSSAPTVTLQTAGSGSTRTIAPVVNGTAGTPVAIPDADQDAQTLAIAGSVLSISGGNAITLPTAPPTTNAIVLTRSTSLRSTVDGIPATQQIPVGTLQEILGYTAAGDPIYQSVSGLAIAPSQITPGTFPSGVLIPASQVSGLNTSGGGGGVTTNTLTVSGSTLTSSVNGVNSNTVTLPAATPPTVTLQASGSGTSRTIAPVVNGTVGTPVAVPDSDSQTLAIAGNALSISGGNSVTLPVSPAPTVTLQASGSGAARTIAPVVNGVAGTSVAVPDLDAQTLAIAGNTLSISGGNSVTLPVSPAPTVTLQTTGSGAARTIAPVVNGVAGTAVAVPDTDLDAQTLAIAGTTLSISGGNAVALPAPTVTLQAAGSGASRTIAPVVNGTAGTPVAVPDLDAQALTISGNTLSISGGNSVTLPSASAPTVTLQTTGSGAARTIAPVVNGVAGTAVAVPDTDLDSQTLAIAGNTLSISGGNSVTLPASPAPTVTLQATGSGSARTIAPVVNGVAGTAVAVPDTDLDAQTLAIAGTTLSISGGNSVTLPAGASCATVGPIVNQNGACFPTVDGVFSDRVLASAGGTTTARYAAPQQLYKMSLQHSAAQVFPSTFAAFSTVTTAFSATPDYQHGLRGLGTFWDQATGRVIFGRAGFYQVNLTGLPFRVQVSNANTNGIATLLVNAFVSRSAITYGSPSTAYAASMRIAQQAIVTNNVTQDTAVSGSFAMAFSAGDSFSVRAMVASVSSGSTLTAFSSPQADSGGISVFEIALGSFAA